MSKELPSSDWKMGPTIGGHTPVLVATLLTDLATAIHSANVNKGFYDEVLSITDALATSDPNGNCGQTGETWILHWLQGSLARCHSEISEGLEYIRKDIQQLDDHLPTRPGFQCEMADAIIRLLDMADFANQTLYSGQHPLGPILMEKLAYNANRPYKHGKKS